MRFRKKPVEIEAYLYGGDGLEAIEWSGQVSDGNGTHLFIRIGDGLFVHTLEGDMKVSMGDWIICGVKGEFYPCRPDIFVATYDSVAPEANAKGDK